jgi:hypothetical protein
LQKLNIACFKKEEEEEEEEEEFGGADESPYSILQYLWKYL